MYIHKLLWVGLLVICCFVHTGCGAKKYSRNDLVGTAIDGDNLVLFIDVASGTQQWEMPDSPNRNGVTIMEHALFRVEYHLGDSRATRCLFLFKEPSFQGKYELSPIAGGGTLVVKELSGGNIKIFSVFYPSNSSQCVFVPTDVNSGLRTVVFTTSNTLLVHNNSQIRMFELPSLDEITDSPILQTLKKLTADLPIGGYKFSLSESLTNCVVYTDFYKEKNIKVYDVGGKMQLLTIRSNELFQSRQIEFVHGQLMWLDRDDRTTVGKFLDNSTYEFPTMNFPISDFVRDRVLFEPLGFSCYEKNNFQSKWDLWYYEKNQVKTFALDYDDLLHQLEAARNSIN